MFVSFYQHADAINQETASTGDRSYVVMLKTKLMCGNTPIGSEIGKWKEKLVPGLAVLYPSKRNSVNP